MHVGGVIVANQPEGMCRVDTRRECGQRLALIEKRLKRPFGIADALQDQVHQDLVQQCGPEHRRRSVRLVLKFEEKLIVNGDASASVSSRHDSTLPG
jgi:hypothetical protein